MAVSRLFQQSRFHLRKNLSDDDVLKKDCLNVTERPSLPEPERISWREQQQLQRALNISLRSPIQKKNIKKTAEVKNRPTRSTHKSTILAKRKFAYPPVQVASAISISDVPNVTKNIIFAEDFIDFLCFRTSENGNRLNGWKVFHQFLECNQKQIKTESDAKEYFSIADSTQLPSDYFEKPLKSSMNFDISLGNDSSDCMSEDSLEPSDISSYFV